MTTIAPATFHVLAKPIGAICNLDCEYCFFLSKQALYPDSRFRMPDKVPERYRRQQLDSKGPEATVAWQGGEPTLMGLRFFRRSVALTQEYAPIFSETCGYAVALEHNGDLYSCDHFVEPKYLLGNGMGTPIAESRLNYLCAGYKAFFNHIDRPMRMMAQLLRQGRYADEVMQILAAEQTAPPSSQFS